MLKILKINAIILDIHKFHLKKSSKKIIIFKKFSLTTLKLKIRDRFFKKLVNTPRIFKRVRSNNGIFQFFFLSRFLLNFVEFFFKSKILFNLKKGSSKILLDQISFRKFSTKYFNKKLKTSKQVIGVLYYALLLKDANMFANFFKKILERLGIKLHKKLIIGFKKLIEDIYKPVFCVLGIIGIFFNLKGKIGVSGNAKKKRRYFYLGKHSITSRVAKMDLKFLPIWTFTGALGFTFFIFF
jgi:hypothetical protein